jgi:hypothetical protein
LKLYYYLKKLFIYLLTTALLLVVTAGVLSYVYKDKIIGLFINEVNKYLVTKVEVGKIDFSIWAKFPQVAVSFENVLIEESIPNSTRPLARLKHLYFTFSLLKIIKGEYEVSKVYLEQGEVTVRQDNEGRANYLIFKSDTTSQDQSQPINFNLERINLVKVVVNYQNVRQEQDFSFLARELGASLLMVNNNLHVGLKGPVLVYKIGVGNENYLSEKEVLSDARLQYNLDESLLTLQPSVLKVQNADFELSGTVSALKETEIDLDIAGKQSDIQTIVSLLPGSIYEKVKVYKSTGQVYFKGGIKGKITDKLSPAVDVTFGCKDASFYHPELKKTIQQANFEGRFSNGESKKASTGYLELRNISGLLEEKQFKGNFYLKNFNDPFVKTDLTGDLDVASLTAFYPIEGIENATGGLSIAIDFEGRLADLKQVSTVKRVKANGEIHVTELGFKLTHKALLFNKLNGNFIFNKNDIAITDFKGNIGQSDFEVNGFFKNFIPFMLFPDQDMKMEASFSSKLLDLDELLAADGKVSAAKSAAAEEDYRFRVAPRLAFDLDCNIERVKFRRFKGNQLEGQISLRNRIARTTGLTLNTMGGNIRFFGIMDARSEDAIEVQTRSTLKRIYVDSAFYSFENFDQSFLQDKNLKGQLNAEVDAFVVMNSKLDIDTRKLVARINASIENGELNDFEPMQALSRFIERRELANLRFSELRNVIHIENRKVNIPEIEIRSNVANLFVMGTHTFDQEMDYKIKIPLSNFRKADKDAAFGEIADDGTGKGNLFLTIKGTSDNFKVGYDTQRVKAKLKDDLRKEKEEIKNLFRSRNTRNEEEQGRKYQEADKKKEEEPEFFDF